MENNLNEHDFKLIVLFIAMPIFVIAGVIYRERRGKELSNAEKDNIFDIAYAAAIVVFIFVFAAFFYFNNRPW